MVKALRHRTSKATAQAAKKALVIRRSRRGYRSVRLPHNQTGTRPSTYQERLSQAATIGQGALAGLKMFDLWSSTVRNPGQLKLKDPTSSSNPRGYRTGSLRRIPDTVKSKGETEPLDKVRERAIYGLARAMGGEANAAKYHARVLVANPKLHHGIPTDKDYYDLTPVQRHRIEDLGWYLLGRGRDHDSARVFSVGMMVLILANEPRGGRQFDLMAERIAYLNGDVELYNQSRRSPTRGR